ncbi:MAG: hypothetical protein KBG98_12130, partial [Desulfobacter sp.]|nr:hypothetical protein [Desulfobacter sp.]
RGYGCDLQTWNGFRLLAVDGSTATVPDEIEVKEHFGAWNVKDAQPCPKARVSQLSLRHILS